MTTVEKLLAPGAIFKRILNAMNNDIETTHLDGSADYQQGFSAGYRAAMQMVKVTEGNLAVEVTALRHRAMKNPASE